MIVAKTIGHTRQHVARARQEGKKIGLFCTLGAIHAGHIAMIRQTRLECDYLVVSIFVNPTQFGPNEDFSKYPRTFEADCQTCQQENVDLVFCPEATEMYPQDNLTWINVEKLSRHLCGASRDGHFRGVCTVVAKLFNIVQPDITYFGRKDAQQLAIIKRMVADLNMNVQVKSFPIFREPDGLAMSSRNAYLNPDQRRQALCLYQALQKARQLFQAGQRDSATLIRAMKEIITRQSEARIDYIHIVDNDLLQPREIIDRPCLIALAVYIGATRLIDNILVPPREIS